MSFLALTAAALLTQAEPSAEPAAEPAPTAEPGPVPTTTTPAEPAAPNAFRQPRPPNPEELDRQLQRIQKLPPSDANDAINALMKRYPNGEYKAPPVPDSHGHDDDNAAVWVKMGGLTEAEQVKYTARAIFKSVLSGDARALVLLSAFPFQLEDRRLELPEELHKEWLKNLRSKRTDLLTLYDVEVLTPAEMEKKYGKPPARLSALPWKASKTFIAIGNISGHAAVAVFKMHPMGRWQLVGYHD